MNVCISNDAISIILAPFLLRLPSYLSGFIANLQICNENLKSTGFVAPHLEQKKCEIESGFVS